jgi:hypothetical protein
LPPWWQFLPCSSSWPFNAGSFKVWPPRAWRA